jgi:lysozyme
MREFPLDWWSTLESVIRYDEGLRYLPYDCATGKPVKAAKGKITIGYGRNLEDKGISEAVASLMLREDIEDALGGARQILGPVLFDSLSAPRQHGLVSMVFQLGAGGVLKFQNTVAFMKQGKWAEAGEEARKSVWYKQTPNRALRVIALIADEKYNYPP